MARDIIIQVRIPRWPARTWLAIALVAAMLGAGAVYAKVNWTPFVGGAKLTSAQLNDNFKAMADAIETLQAAPPVLLPHLYDNVNKVDLGTYLGPLDYVGGRLRPLVYSATLKAPFLPPGLGNEQFDTLNDRGGNGAVVNFDANNCTGNAWVSAPPVSWPSDVAFNSVLGTIWQLTGPQQGIGVLTYLDKNGKCVVAPTVLTAYPAKDTKVANVKSIDIYQTSFQWK